MRIQIVSSLLLLSAALSQGQTFRWKLIGWNDLGMHWMDGDYSVFAILPPANTVHAQLIDPSGRLIRNPGGITVTYAAVADPDGSVNSVSAWKTSFWKFVRPLFGAGLEAEAGLAGYPMPGAQNRPQPMKFEAARNWFTAEGIPITTWDDAGNKNYYPLMQLTASDASGEVLATTQVVLPVSDEMNCRVCHASGARPETQPSRGWARDPNAERDFKWNILRLHDDFQRNQPAFVAALAAAGYSRSGLAATAESGTPVLCAKCHASNALGITGQPGVPPLTQSIHSWHSHVTDLANGLTLGSSEHRSACYRCHPGSQTRFPRGVMGAAVAADGSQAIGCQSCHGAMSAVGAQRTGWLDQPNCQACHTGTAVRNSGQIRFTSVFDNSGRMRLAADTRFATSPDTPAPGVSLYRFSTGHGGLQCEACHGSTHAEFPSTHTNDNLQSIALQGYAGNLAECTACHPTSPVTITGGPHGMHPVGEDWVDDHGDAAEDNTTGCRDCHGADLRGTELSRARTTRVFRVFDRTRQLFRGAIVNCWTCHNGPGSEDANPSPPPVASDGSAATAAGVPVAIPLRASGGALRIISQPANGTVALSGATATFTPFAGFEGADSFTFASFDGMLNSNLARVAVTVTAPRRPVFTAASAVNAASYRGGAVTPGELVTIFGEGMGPATLAGLELNSAGLVARARAGTRVLFDGMPAPVIYASASQVAAVVPYATAGKTTVQVQVESQGIRSAGVAAPVAAATPGIFAAGATGSGQGAILNQDGVTVNSAGTPAEKGSIVVLFGTGEGRVDRSVIDGSVSAEPFAQPVLPVSVEIGGIGAEILYRGAAPGLVAGVMQVNVRVPQNAPSGAAVPVLLRVGEATSQSGITMAVR